MSYVLFMSDMHLDPSRADISQLFIDYLRQHGPDADAIYLLGDLFEVWLGDNVSLPDYENVIGCLKSLSASTKIYVMRGNRDFMLAQKFAEASGCELLSDPQVINLYGQDILISHGDLLCTDDVNYQRYRKIVSQPWIQWLALKLIPDRKKRQIATKMRAASKNAQAQKDSVIMDVNPQAVKQWFRRYQLNQMIHGHTHRPNCHDYEIDGNIAQRWVLGDWYHQGSVLRINSNAEPELMQLPLS